MLCYPLAGIVIIQAIPGTPYYNYFIYKFIYSFICIVGIPNNGLFQSFIASLHYRQLVHFK